MLRFSLSGIDGIKRELDDSLKKVVKNLAEEVYVDAKSNTPVKSGNARRNWQKKVDNNGFVVENRVPYIERLEAGASKQAPKGIIGPTLSQVKGKL